MERREYLEIMGATAATVSIAGCSGSDSPVSDSWEDIKLEENETYEFALNEQGPVDSGNSVEIEFEEQDDTFYINMFDEGKANSMEDVEANTSYELGFPNETKRTLFVDGFEEEGGEMYLDGRIEEL